MCKFFTLLTIFVLAELLLALAFSVIAQVYYKEIKGFDFKSIAKGTIERIFLSVSLINGLPHALTFFSALKLATRLKHDEPKADHNKFNDYYLVGNLVSVLVAIWYWYIFDSFSQVNFFIKICS